MNAAWNHIAKSIFDRPDVENISLEELDYLVEEYPYFPVIHFLRTRKLLSEPGQETAAETGRTALYFSNPHWLQYQLRHIETKQVMEEPIAEVLTTPSYANELSAVLPQENVLPAAEIVQEEKEMLFDEKRIFPEDDLDAISDAEGSVGEVENVIAEEQLPATDETEPSLPDQNSAEKITAPFEIEKVIADNLTGEEAPVEEKLVDESTIIVDNPGFEEVPVQEQLVDESTFIVDNPGFEELPVQEQLVDESAPIVANLTVQEKNGEIAPAEDHAPMVFEPLYTVDYFASQGIKLKLDEEPTDKLSVKLRSFTDWLKAMKKIHPEKLDHKMGQEEENNIRVYAETSNEPRELYTEALAEVYLQQGLRQKAATVFEKLSLLDPSKSAYFAARIRDIKET